MRSTPLIFRILIASLFLMTFAQVARAGSVDYVDRPWSFTMGGGYSPVVGGLDSKLSDGWNFKVGTEYNFNERFGLALEYMNNHLGVESGVLNQYSARLGGAPTDGSVNIWSLTLNPTWRFEMGHGVGGYLIAGGGYYHVNAQITTPGVAFAPGYCDPFWGCWPGGLVGVDNEVAEHKDDTGGVNLGGGFTFDLRHDVQFFIESRYHYLLLHGPDLQLFPLTAGFRF